MIQTARWSLFVAGLSVGVLGCGGLTSAGQPDAAASIPPTSDLISSRPYKYKVPKGYDAKKPTPLVVMLHGLGASGELNELVLHLAPLADSRTFIYAYPDGTVDRIGQRFWNATDHCCNFFNSDVDDVAYLTAVIDDLSSKYNVDAKRVFLVGHSNGGYMAHRMACDRSTKIAGIVSLAGGQWVNATNCRPQTKVSVLQVHGDKDTNVAYDGTPFTPSAHQTVAIWADRNACTGLLTNGGIHLDIEAGLAGAETRVEAYAGCRNDGSVELWTIEGGGHIPNFNSQWPGAIYDFLMAHPKP